MHVWLQHDLKTAICFGFSSFNLLSLPMSLGSWGTVRSAIERSPPSMFDWGVGELRKLWISPKGNRFLVLVYGFPLSSMLGS
jgi:hypothetical protein